MPADRPSPKTSASDVRHQLEGEARSLPVLGDLGGYVPLCHLAASLLNCPLLGSQQFLREFIENFFEKYELISLTSNLK